MPLSDILRVALKRSVLTESKFEIFKLTLEYIGDFISKLMHRWGPFLLR